MMNIYVASKNEMLIKTLKGSGKYSVVGVCENKAELPGRIRSLSERVDILLVLEGLDGRGQTIETLIQIKRENPLLRIIYLTGPIKLTDGYTLRSLISLTDNHIYDIYHETIMSKAILEDLIDHPKTAADVSYLSDYLRIYQTANEGKEVLEEAKAAETPETQQAPVRDNMIVFSSIKPGSGKSFISTNIAVGIAAYGRAKNNYQPPKVCLVEGDLQTLSVGTLLGVSNSSYNLKEALFRIGTIVSEDGQIIGSEAQQHEVNEFIRRCCIAVPQAQNLYALTGTSISLEEMNRLTSFQYYYLINALSDLFDVVIVDANSSLEHKTSGPILQLAKQVFMIMTPDFNSVRINRRYQKDLNEFGIGDKTRYIVNKSLTPCQAASMKEPLEYDEADMLAGFDVAAKIPYMDTMVAYNHLYEHKPVILDDGFETLQARLELAKLANLIWPMDCFGELAKQIQAVKDGKPIGKAAEPEKPRKMTRKERKEAEKKAKLEAKEAARRAKEEAKLAKKNKHKKLF
jgi:MinD-like ATPase involved in chromosome partitioning or flagellar assembly